MAGVVTFLSARRAAGPAIATAAAGLKASGAIVAPYLVLASRPRIRLALGGAVLAGMAVVLVALVGFGSHAVDAIGILSSNQGRSSRWSFPYKTAQLFGAILPGDRLDYRSAVRVMYGVAFAAVALWLLVKTWRGMDPIRAAGWATLALLVASAWLVPWYALWLLPLVALTLDRRLLIATTALCAWMLVIAVPL
jgi:alpha-1,6-mannosyltransferase